LAFCVPCLSEAEVRLVREFMEFLRRRSVPGNPSTLDEVRKALDLT